MSMVDDLASTERAMPGPLCYFQQVRKDEGEERFAELMEMLLADGYSAGQKQIVLAQHGYEVNRLLVERHTMPRITARHGCVRCSQWAARHA